MYRTFPLCVFSFCISFEFSVLIFSSLTDFCPPIHLLNSDLCSVVMDGSTSDQDLLDCAVLALDLRHMQIRWMQTSYLLQSFVNTFFSADFLFLFHLFELWHLYLVTAHYLLKFDVTFSLPHITYINFTLFKEIKYA